MNTLISNLRLLEHSTLRLRSFGLAERPVSSPTSLMDRLRRSHVIYSSPNEVLDLMGRHYSTFRVIKIKLLRLRMPNEWHICKEGQAGNKKRQRRGLLCSLNYLAFPRPAADRAVSILPWFVTELAHTGFSGLVQSFKKK
jgi:hypothetical protein